MRYMTIPAALETTDPESYLTGFIEGYRWMCDALEICGMRKEAEIFRSHELDLVKAAISRIEDVRGIVPEDFPYTAKG